MKARRPNERTETVEMPSLVLRAEVRAESLNREARTADVVFSAGAAVERMDWRTGQRYLETLSLKKAHVRLDRLNKSAPVLDTHSSWSIADVMGVVVPGSARVANDEATATLRFSKREDVEPVWQDVQDGIVRNVSVGYRVYKYDRIEASEGQLERRHAVDWEPHEISVVPMGADVDAKLRDQAKGQTNPCVMVTRATQTPEERPMGDENREQATETQEQPGVTPNPGDPGAPTAPPVAARAATPATERQAGVDAERVRVQGIIRAVTNAGFPQSLAERMIGDNTPLERAQAHVLDELGKLERGGPRSGAVPTVDQYGSIRVVGEPGIHIRAGIENALLYRVAPEYFKLEDVGRGYAGRSLLDLAERCLNARGLRTTAMSKMQIASLALGLHERGAMHTTSDFLFILEDVANKTLRRAYDEAPQTFQAIARRVELPDFKPVRRVQLGEAPSLEEVLEHGEFTRGTIGNAREQYQLRTWGKVFGITRQSLVNDDTDAFSRLAMMFGRAARHLESDLVWAQITGNPTMGDSVALFDAAHGNVSGGATAIAVASIGTGRAKMRLQTGVDGVQKLNLAPKYLVVPTALETVADQFVSTNLMASQSSSVNPFAGRLQVIAEPRLDDVSATVWYLAASPEQIDMVEYGFLAGENGPAVESRVGFDVDGLEIKCRHDVAAKVIDWRGFYRNSA